MRLLITGATGYIGKRLVSYAIAQGHEVVEASRQQSHNNTQWLFYDLKQPAAFVLPGKVDVVFHLAASTSGFIDRAAEVIAAQHLIKAVQCTAAKIIFISSQAARENAPTAYGKTKWQIERLILEAGGVVVRPGQVYGGPEQALFGSLVKIVRSSFILPAFCPAPKIQPIHIDDLVGALMKCAESRKTHTALLCLGEITPISFTDFLRILASKRVRGIRLFIPLPVIFVRSFIWLLGNELSKKTGVEKLTSLFDLPVMKTDGDLKLLDISLRHISVGMNRSSSGRRELIQEGQALMRYVLKVPPTRTLISRYVRCIESIRDGVSMQLPNFMLRVPLMIALIDESAALPEAQQQEFMWRLNAAIVIAEASVLGAVRFLAIKQESNFIGNGLHILYALIMECLCRLASVIAKPLLRFFMHKYEYSS